MKRMLKENSLKNKSILVTGGGSGLGRSMVEYFYELGADIIITSRRENLLTKVAKEISSSKKGKILPVACDVRNIDEVNKKLGTSI